MNEIKEARERAGITQRQMSVRMQIPQRTIENWESGARKPAEYIKRLVVNELNRMAKE